MRLSKLEISNYGPIGSTGCKIKIDNIVVLIGPNNVGKSTILDAYEAFASSGQGIGKEKFFNREPLSPVVIAGEFSHVTAEDLKILGDGWKYKDEDGHDSIKVRWIWETPGSSGKKQSWDPKKDDWIDGGVGGWDSLLVSRIPVPLRIKATDGHEKIEEAVVGLLTEAIKTAIKSEAANVGKIVEEINTLTNQLGEQLKEEADKVCNLISSKVENVFPGYRIKLSPGSGKFEAEKVIGTGSYLTITSDKNTGIALANQGSGVQRTFLWSAISALAEEGKLKKGKSVVKAEKPRILLIDEPESFLHPPLVRLAREALYSLASVSGWQVMAATHSPVFIDVSKPHTTIVAIKNNAETSAFSVKENTFTDNERENLRIIRSCHPTINEFFFARKVILVEGETETTVFSHLFQDELHRHELVIINCMGKANLVLFAKILNQFGTPYIIVHDTDAPKAIRKKKPIANAMWKENEKIFEIVKHARTLGVLAEVISSIPDFERAYFDEEISEDKPFFAHQKMTSKEFKKEEGHLKMQKLKEGILKGDTAILTESFSDMEKKLKEWVKKNGCEKEEIWQFS